MPRHATPRTALTFDAVIRVSRRNGRTGDAFMSPAEQRAAIEARAERDGITIATWHDETDSVSGGTVDRAGLQAAIDRAVRGDTDGIIVAKVDRFARTVQGGLSAIVRLEDAGRQLWSAREGVIVGDDQATATDKLIRTFWLMLAQWQRDTLTEGWEATRRRHIANGVANHAPYGYQKGGDRRLIADPDEAPWVVAIFERRADRWPWARIADWLTEQGATPRNRGAGWSITSVRRIVSNRVYLGEIRSGDIVNADAHEPLVSVDLWNRANNAGTTRGPRRAADPYLLQGVIRCASCGGRMFGNVDRRTNAAGDPVEYRFYRCRGRHSWGRCDAPARIDVAAADAIVIDQFARTFLADRVAVPVEATDDVAAAEAEVAAAEAELDAFVTNAAALDADLFTRGIAARQERLDAARQALADARSAALGVALPVGLADVWADMDTAERKPYIADAFAAVYVRRGRGPAADRVRTWLMGDPTTPATRTDGPAPVTW